MAPGGVSSGLLIGLPSLELRLQFRPELAVGPLFVALAAMEEHPLPDLVAPPLSGGRQQVEEVPPQVGKSQGLMQGFLLRVELLQEALHLHKPMGEVADGDRGKALIIRAEAFTGSGARGDTGFREQGEGFRGAGGGLHAQLAHQGGGFRFRGLSGSGLLAFCGGLQSVCLCGEGPCFVEGLCSPPKALASAPRGTAATLAFWLAPALPLTGADC
jgi:hypothetical protein